jgi:hypothetical protein
MNINFKTYDPVAQLIASGGGGSSLPLLGGTLMGNLTMSIPYKVIQCQTPSDPCDVVNLVYLNSLYLPLAGGTMSGVINQPSLPTSPNELANKAYVDSLIGGGPFLPLSGGTMTGEILQPLAPSTGNALTNKTYVDAQISAGTPDATTLVKGKVQLAGDLGGVGTSAAAPIITSGAVSNLKLSTGTNSTLKGTSGSGVVSDITLGPGLSMPAGVLNLDPATIQKAGATQFGVVEFDPSGDLNATAANSGIGVVKPLAITNAKLADLSGPSRLKGSSSTLPNATDISLGTNLIITGTTLDIDTVALSTFFLPLSGGTMTGEILQSLSPSTGNALANRTYVDTQVGSVVTPDATTSVKGKIKLAGDFDPLSTADVPLIKSATTTVQGKIQLAGDLTGTASLPVIDVNKVTYPKIQQVGASTLLGNSTGALANVQEITLGSLVFTSNILNSPISFYGGTDPNLTAPTDRPTSNNTLYMGTDNNIWFWTGLLYMPITPKKLVAFTKTTDNQTMVVNDLVQFTALSIDRQSTQGLTIIDSTNGSIFTVTLEPNRPSVLLKITVSISGLYTAEVFAKFFTFNLTTAANTGGPGMILNTNSLTTFTSTHIYSETILISPGTSTDYGIRLRIITGVPTTINIGNGGGVPLPYRWIMFEEL